jgi:uncharacterized protein YndB with AHSA1/START domain
MTESNDAGITITRVLEAPRDLVFKAWTTPEHFAHWFGGELDIPLDTVAMDVRQGGAWSLAMTTPDGGRMPFSGVYREVVEPERLVFTLKDASAPADADGEVVSVTFTDLGAKTEMVFHQGGGNLDTQQYEQAREGWSTFFDRLTERLAG